jgi:hypothetical protein
MPKTADKPVKNPVPRCGLCGKYESHGQRCGHVDCPCRKEVTAQPIGSTLMLNPSATVRKPTTRTDREYD